MNENYQRGGVLQGAAMGYQNAAMAQDCQMQAQGECAAARQTAKGALRVRAKQLHREADRMNDLRTTTDNPEVKRMASVAITEAQTAQMWAVKAVTWRA